MIKRLFEDLLIRLTNEGISEYYQTPGSKPYYRVDGRLQIDNESSITTLDQTEGILNEVLLEKEKSVFTQDGIYELAYSIEKIGRFRVRFGRQRSSIAIVIIVKNPSVPDVETLQLPAIALQNMDLDLGLYIICGEKKSRKLTTAAALIKYAAEHSTKIITAIEDPIEYLLPHGNGIVNQMEVGIDIKDLKMGLNEGISNNSDIIFLSDMSSVEEIRAIFAALEKGCFIITAMHATGVEAAINHILNAFNAYEQQHIRRLLAQHLISIIYEQNIVGINDTLQPIYEVLINNSAVQSMFMENKLSQLKDIFESFPGTGMCSINKAIIQAVLEGRITKEEAIMVSKDPKSIIKRLNGVN